MSREISTHMYNNEIKSKYDSIAYYIMLLFIGVGLYFRMKGLGKWSFWNDEYYLAQSVRNILETGLPSFKSGGYYVRGILYQYIMVPFVALGFPEELSFRLVAVLSSLIAIPALYQLSKKISGVLVASLVIIALSISTLEIEFSRYARMYMPFQALFLWYLLFLYKAVVEQDSKSRIWMYCLSFVSMFVFEQAIFLAILNFFPLTKNLRKADAWHILISISILLIVYSYLSFDFRHFPLGRESFWPQDIPRPVSSYTGIVHKPLLMLSTIISNSLWLSLFTIPLSLSFCGVYKVAKANDLDPMAKISFALLIFFAVFNLYGLLVYSLFLLLLLDYISVQQLRSRIFGIVTLILLANLLFWISYGLITDLWPHLLHVSDIDWFTKRLFEKISIDHNNLRHVTSLFLVLFNYPYNLVPNIYEWFHVYPIFTLISGGFVAMGIGYVLTIKYKHQDGFRFLASILMIVLLCLGMLNPSGSGTRFTFFLSPIILLLVIATMQMISESLSRDSLYRKVLVLVFFFTFIGISEDINFSHIINIDSPQVNFRKIYYDKKGKVSHYISRRDYRGVAEVIDRETRQGDIVISAHQTVAYYTKKIDYIFFGTESSQFGSYTAAKGTKERWTNLDLIYQPERLFNLVDNARSTVWIVVNIRNPSPHEMIILEKFGDQVYFTAQDDTLVILKLTKNGDKSRLTQNFIRASADTDIEL